MQLFTLPEEIIDEVHQPPLLFLNVKAPKAKPTHSC